MSFELVRSLPERTNPDTIYEFTDPKAFGVYHQNISVPFALTLVASRSGAPKETIVSDFAPNFQANSAFAYSQFEEHHRPGLHEHNYFELMYVLRGNIYQAVEGKRYFYTTGSGCLMNRNTVHAEEYANTTDCTVLFLDLTSEFVSRLVNYDKPLLFDEERTPESNPVIRFMKRNTDQEHAHQKDFLDFVPLLSETEQKTKVHNIFEDLLYTILNPHFGSTYRLMDQVCRLLYVLGNAQYYSIEHITAHSNMDAMLFARIDQILNDTHGRISNRELAEMLNYNGSYLGSIVKKITGKSLFEYSMDFSMEYAERMLRDSDMSISAIASELKFSNRTHFYRLFEQRHHMTPRRYRQLYAEQPAVFTKVKELHRNADTDPAE